MYAIRSYYDEDFNEDVAAPQSWEQEDGKSVSFSATAASAIDLATVTADSVAVCSFTAPPVSEGQTITGFDLSFDQKIRITSYNVCYTKLLRNF